MTPRSRLLHVVDVPDVITRRRALQGMGSGILLAALGAGSARSAALPALDRAALFAQATPVPTVSGSLRPRIDFQTMAVGPGPNPIDVSTDAGVVSFKVDGAANTDIQTTGGYTGLHAGPETTVVMDPVTAIAATILTGNGATKVTAFAPDGQQVGASVLTNPAGSFELVTISGSATGQEIASVVISEPAGGHTLLLDFCLEPPGLICLDFRQYAAASGPNPRLEQGHWFVIREFDGTVAATSEIWDISDPPPRPLVGSGLNLNYQTDILLPACAAVIEVALVLFFSAPVPVDALDATGAVIASGATPTESLEHVVTLKGPDISQVRIAPPQNETVLRGLCYKPC